MKRILITQGTSILAIRLSNLLKDKMHLQLASSDEIPSVFASRYAIIPKGVNPTFAHELLKLALDLQCDYILPLQTQEVKSLSEASMLFEEYGIAVLAPSPQEFTESDILIDPEKELPLSLVHQGTDLISGEAVEVAGQGLGLIPDTGDRLILTLLK